MEIKPMFVTPEWHRPYGQALLEADSAEAPALIALAKRAILARYFELSQSRLPNDERLDLERAETALSQLNNKERYA
jgi:hypothetical protein